jgi:hypothetical protein
MKQKLQGFSGYIPGAVFIILGLLLIVFPMLLVVFFSATFILIGMAAVFVAHGLRRRQGTSGWKVSGQAVNSLWGERLQRVFIYRRS